ncbi:hypothetical protein VTL71DRAFT_4624, partial [Oculimacula yallundae]
MNNGTNYCSTAALHHPVLDNGTLPPCHPGLHGSSFPQKTPSLENLCRSNTRTPPLRMACANLKIRENEGSTSADMPTSTMSLSPPRKVASLSFD